MLTTTRNSGSLPDVAAERSSTGLDARRRMRSSRSIAPPNKLARRLRPSPSYSGNEHPRLRTHLSHQHPVLRALVVPKCKPLTLRSLRPFDPSARDETMLRRCRAGIIAWSRQRRTLQTSRAARTSTTLALLDRRCAPRPAGQPSTLHASSLLASRFICLCCCDLLLLL